MLVEQSTVRIALRPAARWVPVASSSASSRRLHHHHQRQVAATPATGTQKPSEARPNQPFSSSTAVRHASTSTSPSSATPPPPPASAPSSSSHLNWNQFLQLRKTRRRYNLVASIAAGASTGITGAAYVASVDLNQLSSLLFGLDPFVGMGLSTMACGALGWLIGPIAGSGVFNMMHRRAASEMLVKEKDFFHRIQKYRADISAGGNLQNTPFPDYYGEKIDSVAAYRQWLRDQRKFSKKREYRPT